MTRDDAIRQHRLEKARRANDRLAVAVLEGERRYDPEPDYPIFVMPLSQRYWSGLRWAA